MESVKELHGGPGRDKDGVAGEQHLRLGRVLGPGRPLATFQRRVLWQGASRPFLVLLLLAVGTRLKCRCGQNPVLCAKNAFK